MIDPENQTVGVVSKGDSPARPEVTDRFLYLFKGMLERAALDAAGISLEDNVGVEWLVSSPACPCSEQNRVSLSSCPVQGAKSESLELAISGQPVGFLRICSRGGADNLHLTVKELADAAIKVLETEDREEQLLEELGASWECLHSVYEISAVSNFSHDVDSLLASIVERMESVRENLQVVLWRSRKGRLEPVTYKEGAHLKERGSDKGLVSEVLDSKKAMVHNNPLGPERLSHDPELMAARNLALIPITGRSDAWGVLAVWQESEGPPFDTKLVRFLESLATQAAIALENDRLHRDWLANERLNQDIEIGSRIQETLLLGDTPKDLEGAQIETLTIPSQRIDGDFFDFSCLSKGCLDMVVGDVMGKGVAAALLAAGIKEQIQKASLELFRNSPSGEPPQPAEIVNIAHSRLGEQLIRLDTFATICYARIDTLNKKVSIVDCGHPKSLHYEQSSGVCQEIAGTNLPLGIESGEEYTQVTVPLGPGDILLFFSDGVTEAMNPKGELFGEERLMQILSESGHLAPKQLVEKIHSAVTTFLGSEVFRDDFSCVVVKIDDNLSSSPKARVEREISSDLQNLEIVRNAVTELCERSALNADIHDHIQLGITEVVSNVMRHSYGGKSDGRIVIRSECFEDRVCFRIYHWGAPFSPQPAVPEPDLSKTGGFGLYLISQIFEETVYSQDQYGRNCIRLVKKLKE